MADRCQASITIGGTLSAALLESFVDTIRGEALSTDWGGAPFEMSDLPTGQPLQLMADEVPWGRFDDLEAFCVEYALPFARWADGYAGEWSAERVVFDGTGEAVTYGATNGDLAMVDRHTATRLGTYAAIIAYFDAADFVVPPLVVSD